MKYVVKISYDGSGFYGFQRLNELRTVQGEMERAISIINKKDTVCKGASRTDEGVHAYGQIVSFELDYDIPEERLKKALNDILERDVYVRECIKVDDEFHPRFNALGKRYVYKIYLGDYDPLKDKYYLQYPYKLNIDKMKEVSNIFIGKHNFKNFVSGERDNYDSIIDSINFKIEDNILEIEFIGKSFYKYMIRNLVGSMIDVARGKRDILEVEKMINEPLISNQMTTISPNGLYLMDVFYKQI